jgi:hypothetical protein
MESQEGGFPSFPHSLEIPSGFPHSHGLGCWHISRCKSMRDRSQGLLDLKGLVTDVSGPQRNACPGTLTSVSAFADHYSRSQQLQEPECECALFVLDPSLFKGDSSVTVLPSSDVVHPGSRRYSTWPRCPAQSSACASAT